MLLLILLFNSTVSHAEIILMEVEKGLISTADDYMGDSAKHVTLILHGFLRTRDFIPIQQLDDPTEQKNTVVIGRNTGNLMLTAYLSGLAKT